MVMFKTLLVVISMARAMSATEEDDAKRMFEVSRREYQLGNWAQAADGFAECYRRTSDPVFLYNLGQARRMEGHYAEAISVYKAYLRERPNAPARQMVENILRELEQKSVKPQHKGTSDIATPTEKLPAAPIPVQQPLIISTPPPTPPQAHAKSLSLGSKAAIAATVVLAGATIYSGLTANSEHNTLDSTCAKTDTGCSDSQVNALRQKALLTNILLGSTIAATAVSGFFVYGDLTTKEVVVAFNRTF